MSQLPLPPSMQRFLQRGAAVSLSLFFDKGMDVKEEFLTSFAKWFNNSPRPDFEGFLGRRSATLSALGARPVKLVTQSRLAIGLGLPHPTETGFLFDRLTGCPYLPGSSVKGLLRAAARLVQRGELDFGEGLRPIEVDRIFGPEIEPGTLPRKGKAVFYDAFPARWPTLKVDVLTPHYGDSYRDWAVPPADWQNPVPVPFLTVEVGVPFCFYIGCAEGDFPKLEKLLGTALDWLGIGAKKSAGYGVFEGPDEKLQER